MIFAGLGIAGGWTSRCRVAYPDLGWPLDRLRRSRRLEVSATKVGLERSASYASGIANNAHAHHINFSESILDDRLSAGDGYRRSGDIAGFIARKHHINGGKLLWLRRTFHRDLLAKVLYLLGRHGRRYQRGPNRTGGHRVRADTPFRKQLGKAPRKVLDGAFRRSVGKQLRARAVRINRRGVDDGAPRFHVRDRSFRDVEHRRNIGGEGQIPFFVGVSLRSN